METGTLKELNVKPGDVVEYTAEGEPLMTPTKFIFAGWKDGRPYDTTMIFGDTETHLRTDKLARFRIISRAAQPTPDLTAITTPFGLLDATTQEALQAHGGPYEYWYSGEWIEGCNVGNLECWAWRVQPKPAAETVVLDMGMSQDGGIDDFSHGHSTAVRVTFNRINGVIDLASYKVAPR